MPPIPPSPNPKHQPGTFLFGATQKFDTIFGVFYSTIAEPVPYHSLLFGCGWVCGAWWLQKKKKKKKGGTGKNPKQKNPIYGKPPPNLNPISPWGKEKYGGT